MARMVVGLASGSVERLLVASTVVGGAVALDMEVDIYLLLGGARAFLKAPRDGLPPEHYDRPQDRDTLAAGMRDANVQMPLDALTALKDTGSVRIHACATAGKIWGATEREAFVDLVDDIVGIGAYVIACEEADVVQVL